LLHRRLLVALLYTANDLIAAAAEAIYTIAPKIMQ
jgi:hypothetical protein